MADKQLREGFTPGFSVGFAGVNGFKSVAGYTKMSNVKLTAVFEKAPEGGYVAWVEELPGANTQGETLEEARANLEEAVTMVLDANREMSEQSLAGSDIIRESLTLPAA